MNSSTRQLVLALSLLASPAYADVMILEAPQLGALRNAQEAVDLAPEGATLVFGQEAIDGFVIDGKSLTLVGPDPGEFVIEGQVIVRNLTAEQSVRAQGLRIQLENELFVILESTVVVTDCAGAVRFSGCTIDGADGDDYHFQPGQRAMVVQDSPDVALLDCTLAGGEGGGDFNTFCFCTGGAGGTALEVTSSEIALYDCQLLGGRGGIAGAFGGDGGTAVLTTDSRFFSSGSLFQGARGGGADDIVAQAAGDGGDGIRAIGFPMPRLLETDTVGGFGGSSQLGQDGETGTPRVWDQGTLTSVPGSHRGLRIPQPIAVLGSTVTLALEGRMGDQFFVGASLVDGRSQRRVPPGVRLLPRVQPITTVPQAVLSSDGVATIVLPAPGIPVGQDQATWILQAFVVNAQGEKRLSGAALVTSMRPDVGLDCNGNAVWDVADALLGAIDCDGNLELDACQVLPDCNGNGVADGLEIDCLGGSDLNDNGVPDSCEGLIPTVYVDPAAAPGGDGSFSSPFSSIFLASPSVSGGGIMMLFDGVYSTGIGVGGVEFTLASVNGPANCIINLQQQGILLGSGFEGNGPPLTLRGLTVRNGLTSHGGVVSASSRPVLVEDCIFRNNAAQFTGGVLRLGPGSRVLRCQFQNNAITNLSGFSEGGAIHAEAPLVVSDCVFDFNTADCGGAIFIEAGEAASQSFIGHSIFRGNEATDSGGAIAVEDFMSSTDGPAVTIDNCFGALNQASLGGFMHVRSLGTPGSVRISSSTLVRNRASIPFSPSSGGGAVFLTQEWRLEILNSILSENTGNFGRHVAGYLNEVVVDHSNTHGVSNGFFLPGGTLHFLPSSLDTDPGFMNPIGDYRLLATSPCVDAGSVSLLARDLGDINGNEIFSDEVPIDLLGSPRRIDDPTAPDVGSGRNPLPDMGAFER